MTNGILEKTGENIQDPAENPEILQEVSPIDAEILRLQKEIEKLHATYQGNTRANHIIDLKAEIITSLKDIGKLQSEQDELGKENMKDIQTRREKGETIIAKQAYVKNLKQEIELEEENLENEGKIVWMELPNKMTLEEANKWIQEENDKLEARGNTLKYELATIGQLVKAYKENEDHFNLEIYLSGTPDEDLKGNARGLNFKNGEEVSIVRTQAVAVKCKTVKIG
jgi:seryl-tRNA synthetase